MTPSMHWARWGDPAEAEPLSDAARGLAELAFGPTEDHAAVDLEDVRLPALGEPGALSADLVAELRRLLGDEHVLVDHESRVRHTRGKSTADLLRLRSGDGADAPDAVLRPGGHDDVAAVLAWCTTHRVAVVPFGGGTSVTGGLAPDRAGYAGLVALDLARLDRLLSVDAASGTAVLEAGLRGPRAEALLAEHGLTLGHFPQSFEYATIGGFAATGSSGQASSGYGRFDELVVALRVATPIGTLELGVAPASAAGPDLRQLVLGSEGAFGVVTSVRVVVRPAPAVSVYDGWRFGSFRDGTAALRDLAQSRSAPTVLRLSDEDETAVDLTRPREAGGGDLVGSGGCLMIAGFEGEPNAVEASRAAVSARIATLGGEPLGEAVGARWAENRFRGPYLRDALLDRGILVETLESATYWSNLDSLYAGVRSALQTALTRHGTPPIVLCHISHVYPAGASLYFTVAGRQTDDPLDQWAAAKTAACDAIVAARGTISHHHGVGRDHRPWLAQEIGQVGVEILRAVKARVDPAGVLNPGVLIP